MVSPDLCGPFWDQAPEALRTALQDDHEWQNALTEACETASRAWPTLQLSMPEFAARIAEVLPTQDPLAALRALAAGDLYLATACARGEDHAVSLCDTHFFPALTAPLARFRATLPMEEALQAVRFRLFVPANDRAPKIAEYAGRGALAAWLRVVAVRTAISIVRGTVREIPVDDEFLGAHVGETEDPELAILKRRYREDFQTAVSEAMAELTSRDRTILRLQYLDKVSIDGLASLYSVHRATAARWVATIRESLRDRTRERLANKLAASEGDAASIMRLVQSQLDLSIRKLLAETSE